jgi:hypothetical protein
MRRLATTITGRIQEETMTSMQDRLRRLGVLALSMALGVAAGLAPQAAEACGGFFCNNQPMDQAGEEIIFSVDPAESTVRAIIKITYEGEAEKFSWVLPVASVPTVSVSANQVFTTIRNLTNPRFEIEWKNDPWECMGWRFDASEGGGPPAPGAGNGGGVTVVDSGQVGPYDYTILESDSSAMLVAWLNENGYVQPPESTDLIDHYVSSGFKFVAIKLQQDKGTGDIAPFVVEMEEQNPCVPLVLTQIAATPDMPVRLWVLGDHRAVPSNWFGVELNLKKLDWMSAWTNGGTPSNYDQVVTDAVNEAAGHGFVTEYAATASIAQGAFYTEDKYPLEMLAGIDNPAEFIMQLQQYFSGSPELLELLTQYMPVPEELAAQGITPQQFYNCVECYGEVDIEFDAAGLIAALDETVVQPMKAAQEMFDANATLTRLYSTVSADEMNRDPEFTFNADLPEVSNITKATGEIICGDDSQPEQIIITLPDGTSFNADQPSWFGAPLETADDVSGEPAAAAITLAGSEGPPVDVPRADITYYDGQLSLTTPEQVITDIATHTPPGGEGGGEPGVDYQPTTPPNDRGGCSATGPGSLAGLFALALLLMALAARRRA